MAMKLKLGQEIFISKTVTLLSGVLLGLLFCCAPVLTPPAFAAATNYVDPVAYPGGWPPDSSWIPYTSNGSNVSDVEGGSGGDASTGGTNPSSTVDIVADYGPAVSWYSDGTNLYFRMQLYSSPLQATGNSKPFTSATWNILLDTDGDGFKEFVVHIDGTGGNQTTPDDIVVIYNDSPTQAFIVTGASDAVWRQDSADNPADSGSQFVDGEPGNNASDWDNDGSPGGPDYDFSRSRVVDVNGSVTYLDFQVPLSSLDAAARGGPTFTTSTPFAMGFSTSNSNTDPVQKDLAYDGVFTAIATSPIPFGDFVDANGNTYEDPIIQSFSASGCGPASLTTAILDSNTVVGGQVVSTAAAEFYYYYDANADGTANDNGSSWYKAGDGIPTNNLAPWNLSWDSSSLPVGQYLLKVIASDSQGNVVDSSSLPSPLVHIHDNSCGSALAAETVDVANTIDASGMGSAAVNADPATSVTTLKPVIRTRSTSFDLFVRNEGSLPQSYSLTVDADGAGTALPAGISVVFKDTGGTIITSTPSLNPGDTFQYLAEVSTTAAISYGSHALFFHVGGINNDIKQDAIAVTRGVDIANSATAAGLDDYAVDADPASAVTTTLSSLAGWMVSFDLHLNNESAINQSFSLSYSDNAGSALTGWSVVFKDSSGTVITSTPVIAAGASYQFSAEITSAATAADGIYPVFFHADGASVATASDVKQDAVQIDSGLNTNIIDLASGITTRGFGLPGIDADPDSIVSSTVYVEPGNVAVFNLYVSNEGTASKSFQLDAFENNTSPFDSLPADWPVVFRDSSGSVITDTPSLTPGSTFAFTAEVTVPAAVTELLKPVYFRVQPNGGGGGWNTDFIQVAIQAAQLADLAIVKTVDNASPQEGDSIVYTLTLTNNGPKNANSIEVTDVLPGGLSYVSDDSAGSYNPLTGLWTLSPLNNGGVAILSITLDVDPGTAGNTITNTATITNSNRIDPDPGNDSSSVNLTVVEPVLTVIKSAITVSDPVNGTTNPYNIPGATVLYSVQSTNTGLGSPDNNSVFVLDPIPANTELLVNDLGAAGSGPVLLIDGTAPVNSGLSYSFTSLGSSTDDIEFSNDNAGSWSYTPVPDADGYDANVTNIRVNPKGVMRASNGTDHPTFTLRFQVRVQ